MVIQEDKLERREARVEHRGIRQETQAGIREKRQNAREQFRENRQEKKNEFNESKLKMNEDLLEQMSGENPVCTTRERLPRELRVEVEQYKKANIFSW